MNLQQVYRIIKEIDSDPSSIQSIGRYILTKNNNQEADITKIFEYYLSTSNQSVSFKLKLLSVMNVILLNPKGRSFIKHFSVRIRSFFNKYSYQIINESEQSIKKIIIMLQTWEKAQVFADNFMKCLKKSASCFLDKYSTKSEMPILAKYTKTFLMAYRDVSKISATYELYQAHCNNLILQKGLNNFFVEVQSQSSNKRDTQQRLKRCEKNIQLLLKNINIYKSGTQQLIEMAEMIKPLEQ